MVSVFQNNSNNELNTTVVVLDNDGKSSILKILFKGTSLCYFDLAINDLEQNTKENRKLIINQAQHFDIRSNKGHIKYLEEEIKNYNINYGHDIEYTRVHCSDDIFRKRLKEKCEEIDDNVVCPKSIDLSMWHNFPSILVANGLPVYKWIYYDENDLIDKDDTERIIKTKYTPKIYLDKIKICETQSVVPPNTIAVFDTEILIHDLGNTINPLNKKNTLIVIAFVVKYPNIDELDKYTIQVHPERNSYKYSAEYGHEYIVPSEKELLIQFLKCWENLKYVPSYIIDFNGLEFDQPLLIHRIDYHNLSTLFKAALDPHRLGDSRIKFGSSFTLSFEQNIYLNKDNVTRTSIQYKFLTHIDLMYVVVRNDQYDKQKGHGLDAIAEYHNLGSKHEVSHMYTSALNLIVTALVAKNDEQYNDVLMYIDQACNANRLSQDFKDGIVYKAFLAKDLTTVYKEFESNMETYSRYCLQDAKLTYDISDKLKTVNMYAQRAKTMCIHPRIALYNGQGKMQFGYIQKIYNELKITEHPISREDLMKKNRDESSMHTIGGLTLHVIPTAKQAILLVISFDMGGAYPNIIMSYTISPENISDKRVTPLDTEVRVPNKDGSCGKDNKSFFVVYRPKTIMPILVNNILNSRAEAKKQKSIALENNDTNAAEYFELEQYALKIIANSLYGVFGSKYNENVYRNVQCSVATTQICGQLLLMCILNTFNKFGLIPLMAVTDSMTFVVDPKWNTLYGFDENDIEASYIIAKKVAEIVEDEANKLLNKLCPGKNTLDMCTEYIGYRPVLNKRKRYSIKLLDRTKDDFMDAYNNSKQKYTGFSLIRRNTTPMAINVANEILYNLHTLDGLSSDKLKYIIKEAINKVEENPRDLVLVHKKSSKSPTIIAFVMHHMMNQRLGITPMTKDERNLLEGIDIMYPYRCISIDGSPRSGGWPKGYKLCTPETANLLGYKIDWNDVCRILQFICDEYLGSENPHTNMVSDFLVDFMKDKGYIDYNKIPLKDKKITRLKISRWLLTQIGIDKDDPSTINFPVKALVDPQNKKFAEYIVEHLMKYKRLDKREEIQMRSLGIRKLSHIQSQFIGISIILTIIMSELCNDCDIDNITVKPEVKNLLIRIKDYIHRLSDDIMKTITR